MRGAAARIRLALAVAVAAAIPFAPGLSRGERLGLSGLVLGYAALVLAVEEIGARRDGFPDQALTVLAGVVTILVATVVLPELLGVALVFYGLSVAFASGIGGRRLGLALAAVAVAAAVVANLLAPDHDRVSALALVLFGAVLPALVVATDVLARGRRRTAERLARLHDALRAVSVTPDLQATLDSIVGASAEPVGAVAVGILLRDGDRLVPAASSSPTRDWMHRDDVDGGPFARAMKRRETVVVPAGTDGLAALVAVPVTLGRDLVGVLAAAFSEQGGPRREDLTLLETYAEQTSLVIVQAQAYEHERQAAEQLAEADRVKGEFLGMVSHELRTPLTAVKGFVDTVLLHWERLPDDRRRELLGRASGNADELNRLVGQLLDFARIEADRVKLEPQVVTVRVAAEAVVEELAAVLDGHRVEVDVPEGLAVTADPDGLAHVLANLLANAAKFSPPGSGIRVRARDADDMVVISVVDDGPGVAPADRERIFERFYQVPGSTAPRKGTGIGLGIARTLVELHGGRIWAEGEPGQGATFSFTMPAATTPGRVPRGAPAAAAGA
ncbi:MAG TPA: ATP-binding protein [Actinomycetota bacterium]|nr:ATP-binding protein [Actinomycetota bacterium]